MTGSRNILSIILIITFLFTILIPSSMNVYAEQVSENLGQIYNEERNLSSDSLEHSQFPDIIPDEQEEPESVTNSVYMGDISPRELKEQKEIIIKYKDLNKALSIRSKIKNELQLSKLHLKNRIKNQKLEIVEIGYNDDINKVLNTLNNDKSIEYAQPNYLLSLNSIPSDQLFSEQWALLFILASTSVQIKSALQNSFCFDP